MNLTISLVVVLIIAIYVWWYFVRSRSMLQEWAKTNGYVVLHSEWRNLRPGPFRETYSKNQAVYFVRLRDANGRERSCWLCLGNYWSGLFGSEVKVKWDDE